MLKITRAGAITFAMFALTGLNAFATESTVSPIQGEDHARFAQITMRQPFAQNNEKKELDSSPIQVFPGLGDAPSEAVPRALLSSELRIVTATIDLFDDNDGDGFYQTFVLRFDPDSYYRRINVFATIDIRSRGGVWNEFYTTDRFTVDIGSPWDVTEISARVLGGYPTNEYDLSITLYEINCCYQPEAILSFDHPVLSNLPLEDGDYDELTYRSPSPFVAEATVAAGAMHPIFAFSLIMLLGLRWTLPNLPSRLLLTIRKVTSRIP